MPERPDLSAEIIRRLADSIEGEVRPGLHDRLLYATDASLYQVEPLAVVIPASTLDAARAVRVCHENGLAVLPRGGGTSLAGQCTNRAVVLDMTPNCQRLIAIDEAGRRCRVEPGLTVDDLNDSIRSSGLFFAPDPATSRQAAIGGCVGNNAAGARSILYGRTSENLLGLKVCLADGSVLTLDAMGIPLSVIVFLGAIVLAGIVVNNAIILIDQINRLRADGVPKREAIVRGAHIRLRPVLMTTTTTVLGLLPLTGWLGDLPLLGTTGEGVELRGPMAVTVISGLVSSTLLTLVVVPVTYSLSDRRA